MYQIDSLKQMTDEMMMILKIALLGAEILFLKRNITVSIKSHRSIPLFQGNSLIK